MNIEIWFSMLAVVVYTVFVLLLCVKAESLHSFLGDTGVTVLIIFGVVLLPLIFILMMGLLY